MRTALATLLLLPAIALAQVPLGPTQDVPAPSPRPRPAPGTGPRIGVPSSPGTSPTAPASPRPPSTTGRATSPSTPSTAPSSGTKGGGSASTLRPVDSKCVPLRGRFMLQFNKADISDVLEQASRWTCRNFMFTDEVARGKITLLSKTPVTAEEAYAAFLAALNSNGIAVYQSGKYYKLVRNADAKKNPIPTYVGEDSGTPSTEQPVTKVIRLSYADADQLRGILGNFISPQGADLQAIPPNILVVTDIGLNIRRIERLVEAIDKPGAGDQVRIVQIRYASAKDIADKVNAIFQAQGGGGAAGRSRARPMLATPRAGGPAVPSVAPGVAGGAVEVSVSKVLPDERTNKLIVIADEKSFQRILELVEQLDVPTSSDGGIHVVFLKNANAEEMAQTLSNLAQGVAAKRAAGATGGLSPTPVPPMGGYTPPGAQPPTARPPGTPAETTAELFRGEVKVTADKTQNALLIQANGSDFQAMSRLIAKLDRPRRQVFVEAVIIEVNLRDELQFGVGAHSAIPVDYKGDKGLVPIASEPGRVSSLNLASAISLGGFLTGFNGPVSAELKALGLNLPSIGVLVQALQSSSDVNVLSTPQLLATDNEESEIAVGQNVPFLAGAINTGITNLLTGGTTSTTTSSAATSVLGTTLGLTGYSGLYAPIQRQNVELRLKIKPQINEGQNVRLTVEEQTEEIASNDPQLGPTTSKRSVKTQIVAKDQGTIVIGGLIQDRTVRSVKKVPVLGSLPIIGWLFRDTDNTKQKTNLLLFLTPYIIRDEADYRRIYEKKRKEQEEFIEQFYGRKTDYKVDVDFARKSGPYAHMHAGIAEEASRVENGGTGAPGERLITPPIEPPRGGGPATPEPGPGAAVPAPATPPEPESSPAERLQVRPESPPPAPAPAAPPAEE